MQWFGHVEGTCAQHGVPRTRTFSAANFVRARRDARMRCAGPSLVVVDFGFDPRAVLQYISRCSLLAARSRSSVLRCVRSGNLGSVRHAGVLASHEAPAGFLLLGLVLRGEGGHWTFDYHGCGWTVVEGCFAEFAGCAGVETVEYVFFLVDDGLRSLWIWHWH